MKQWYNEKTPSHPYSIIMEPMNTERLFKFQKSAELKNEIVKWLNENIGTYNWDASPYIGMVSFSTEDAALAFILRWS